MSEYFNPGLFPPHVYMMVSRIIVILLFLFDAFTAN